MSVRSLFRSRRRPLSGVRKVWQIAFLGLFFFLFWATWFPRNHDYPVSLFLRMDPLAGLGIALTSGFLPKAMLLSLAILLSAIFLGRSFCGWVCPLGTLNEAMGWMACVGKNHAEKGRMHRPSFSLKYGLLAFLIALALGGALEVGLFSPLPFLTRSLAAGLGPALNLVLPQFYVDQPTFRGAWILGGGLLVCLLANLWRPRFWCRAVCPLGAFLGASSRWTLFGVERDEEKCVSCGRCVQVCGGACEPDGVLVRSECIACLRCRDVCPTQAIRLGWLSQPRCQRPGPDFQRRHLIVSFLAGAAAAPLLKASGRTGVLKPDSLIRPPGSLAEEAFLGRCLQCGACMRVCPNNALQPALGLSGPQGLFTPVIVPRIGYCELQCTSCGEVCPSGAIRKLTLEDRTGAERVQCGTAFFDRSRCLPWAMEIPCGVCQEVCPVSPKAIYPEEITVQRNGEAVTLKRYWVDATRCIGCGLCENVCPIKGLAGVRVSAAGETRDPGRSLLL